MADAELAELRKQCMTSLFMCTENVCKYLDEDKETHLEKLKSYVTEYCTIEAQQNVAMDALEKAKKETDFNNIDSLQDKFNGHLKKLVEKRSNPDSHPYMTEFLSRVSKLKQRAQENLNESDLAMTESVEQYIDPITKRPIVEPVKNKRCGHVYEEKSIMEMLRITDRTKCPVAGCKDKAYITRNDLILDEELKLRITLSQDSTVKQDS